MHPGRSGRPSRAESRIDGQGKKGAGNSQARGRERAGRLVRAEPGGACFIGISFHHLKKRGGHLVYASVAQAFSSDHEPFCLKGAHIDHEQRHDRQPFLNKSQAFSMMRDILHGYEKRTGVKPKRVVVHKTSMYQPEEEEGFRDGAKGIVPGCDLIWLRQTTFRLVRKGSEEPWRGTPCQVESESFLFTS